MNPIVSICCPVYNEERNIVAFLQNLLEDTRTLDCTWELLLCLSGCTDRTALRINEQFSQVNEMRVLVEEERRGKANAVKKLRSEAMGDYLIFTDGDVLWQKGACDLLLRRLKMGHIGIVAGRILPLKPGHGLLDRINVLSFEYWHRLRELKCSQEELWAISGQIYAIRKCLASTMPDSIINEDAFIGKWVKTQGYLVDYEPRAIVLVNYPKTWQDFFTQKVRNRSGWLQLSQHFGKDVIHLQLELRQMVLNDIVNSVSRGKLDRFILLIADAMCYVVARARLQIRSPESLVKWRRISQSLTETDEQKYE